MKDKEFMNLIKSMLFKNIRKRIFKFSEIKNHPFYAGFQWDGLIDMTLEPCYKIKLDNYETKEQTSFINYISNNPFNYKPTKKYKDDHYMELLNNWFDKL